MLLSHLFERKHLPEADIASVNWHTDMSEDSSSAFQQGYERGLKNYRRGPSNPYPPGTEAFADYNDGYQNGEADSHEKYDTGSMNEAPGAETLSHNQSTVAGNMNSLDLDETEYNRDDYYNARTGGEYGKGLSGPASGNSSGGGDRDDVLKGQSKNLPADPFGRTTGDAPRSRTGRVHHIANPDEMDEGDISQLEKDIADAPVEPIANMEAQEKIGGMDADAFDAAMARLKKLAGSGPLKTVWDPKKRVYKNMPTAVQPKK